MKKGIKYFLNGILTVVPVLIVIWVVVKVFEVLDGLLGRFLKGYMGEAYVPGIGLILSVLIIALIGALSNFYVSRLLFQGIDLLFEKIPLVKSLYSIVKDTLQAFLGEKRSFSKVVLVKLPGTAMKVLGFVTQEEAGHLADPLKDHLAVYVPQTFQMAGVTFLVPREDVEFLDLSPEEAMKFILSGGMANR